jgi:hypothetical protein
MSSPAKRLPDGRNTPSICGHGKRGDEVASDGFKLEIPASAKQLTPGEVAELNEIPALFSAKGVK